MRIDNSPVLRYNTIQLAAVAELADARDLNLPVTINPLISVFGGVIEIGRAHV